MSAPDERRLGELYHMAEMPYFGVSACRHVKYRKYDLRVFAIMFRLFLHTLPEEEISGIVTQRT
jgi:hypothetical protein